MRRALVILLVLLFALQSAWAAGLCVCEDERKETVAVLVEQMQLGDAAQSAGCDSPDGSDGSGAACNPQCGACHLGLAQLTPSGIVLPTETLRQRLLLQLQPPRQSHIPEGLDKPDWRAAA